jgi:glycosyltransferase involved in cell wall biosynthesis
LNLKSIEKPFLYMTIQPLVSVLVPLYNKVGFIAETIESVLNQTYLNIELIIIDDGSTDGSFEIAKRYESSTVSVFRQANKGASAARNAAFNYSKGDFIQYLDADDILDPHKIEEQVVILRGGQPNVLASAKVFFFRAEKDGTRQTTELQMLNKDYEDMTAFLLDEVPQTLYVMAWLTPRNLVQKAGKWDETMTIFDDCDFYLRLVPLASKIVYCSSAICFYRLPTSSNHLSQQGKLSDIEGAMRYFSRFEAKLVLKDSVYEEQARQGLACLYKKILFWALHQPKIKEELLKRCLRLEIVPDCSQAQIIKWIRRYLGIRVAFKMVVFKMTWLDKYLKKNDGYGA